MKRILISSLKNVQTWLFERFLEQVGKLDCEGLEVSYFWATEKKEIQPFFLSTKCDYLFYIDAHMMCHPKLLKHLIALGKEDVRSGVEIGHLFDRPSTYPLDECRLVTRAALMEPPEALCDLYYPVFPIFEYEDLELFVKYSQKWALRERQPKTLTLSMVFKHYQEKYLEATVSKLKPYLNFAIIFIEEQSDLDCIKKHFTGIPYQVNVLPKGIDEAFALRPYQWEETIKTKPEWVLFLDGDEQLEDEALQYLPHMIREDEVSAYNFRSYCMWNKTQYREDSMWQTHQVYMPFMVCYNPFFDYHFTPASVTGRVPDNVLTTPYKSLTLRIKKWAFADAEDRKAQYKACVLEDPLGQKQSILYYVSLIDRTPVLKDWE